MAYAAELRKVGLVEAVLVREAAEEEAEQLPVGGVDGALHLVRVAVQPQLHQLERRAAAARARARGLRVAAGARVGAQVRRHRFQATPPRRAASMPDEMRSEWRRAPTTTGEATGGLDEGGTPPHAPPRATGTTFYVHGVCTKTCRAGTERLRTPSTGGGRGAAVPQHPANGRTVSPRAAWTPRPAPSKSRGRSAYREDGAGACGRGGRRRRLGRLLGRELVRECAAAALHAAPLLLRRPSRHDAAAHARALGPVSAAPSACSMHRVLPCPRQAAAYLLGAGLGRLPPSLAVGVGGGVRARGGRLHGRALVRRRRRRLGRHAAAQHAAHPPQAATEGGRWRRRKRVVRSLSSAALFRRVDVNNARRAAPPRRAPQQRPPTLRRRRRRRRR